VFFSRKKSSSPTSHDNRSLLDTDLVMSLASSRRPSFKQLKHIPRFLSAKQRGLIKTCIALILVSALAVTAKFSSEHIRRVPATGGDYIEATIGEPHYINPILSVGNDADNDLIKLLFAGLMRTDTAGAIVPDMAEKYEVSKDGKTYTFTLREGLQWHDGTLVSASDVVFTIHAIQNPAWKSPLYTRYRGLQISSKDERTIVVVVSEPSAVVLPAMTVGILPEHLWQDVIPENALRAELNIKPIGTGPFKLKNFSKDKLGAIHSVTLSRYDKYHLGAPHLDTMSFDYFAEYTEAVSALLNRKVQGVSYLPTDSEQDVAKNVSLKVSRFHLPQYNAVFLNQTRQPAFASLKVRTALFQAINIEKILGDVLENKGAPSYGPLLPGLVGFTPDVLRYPFDVTAATEALDAEGWKLGTDGIRTKKTTPLAFTLTTVDTKELSAVAEAIKEDLGKIGVRVTVNAVPRQNIQKDVIRARDYDALLYGEIVGADSDLYPFWHSSQSEGAGLNLAMWKNTVADGMLDKARTVGVEERAKLYQSFQDVLLKDLPAWFIYSPTYPYAMTRTVKGLDPHLLYVPADRFADVQDWYIETAFAWE
jgi:peptide/nickel transport system substrate-binding protein